MCSAGVALAAPAAPDVNQAKANMLFNIAKFVEWPGLSPDKSTPLVFTILGEDELAAQLAGLLSTKTVNGRPVFVRFARRPQDATGSQIIIGFATEGEHVHFEVNLGQAERGGLKLSAKLLSLAHLVSDAPGSP